VRKGLEGEGVLGGVEGASPACRGRGWAYAKETGRDDNRRGPEGRSPDKLPRLRLGERILGAALVDRRNGLHTRILGSCR
jgi:hypothetical protein